MNDIQKNHAKSLEEIMEGCGVDYQIMRAILSAEESLDGETVELRIAMAGVIGRLRAIRKTVSPSMTD
jgi:hypothetical protein